MVKTGINPVFPAGGTRLSREWPCSPNPWIQAMEGRAETSPAPSTPSHPHPGFARGLEVPRTSGNGEKLPAELPRKNSKTAESVGGQTSPQRSDVPARSRRKERGVCSGRGISARSGTAPSAFFPLAYLFFEREKALEEGVEVK